MTEIEVKLRIDDAGEARRRLGLAGAVALEPRGFEDNRVYDDADGSLRARRMVLRLRTTGGRNIVTLKLPPEGGADDVRYKVRIEHETTVEDADAFDALLTGLGYRVRWRYQKYRQPYHLGEVKVLLDETPIGTFYELEGQPAAIDAAAAALGFGPGDYVTATYRALHEQAAGTDEPGHLVFEGTPGT